tara:strand:- start:5249 stop:5728 length:480 start_codon:yes stop_codon:yes gene_type:complete
MINYLKITFGILIVLSASRFIPHPPNFTALIALSFYIPALLGKKYIPSLLGCFILTDLFLGIHQTILFTWGSIILIGFISNYLNYSLTKRITGSIFSACLFFLITNFGVWLTGSYGFTLNGLLMCFILAIPFFGYTLLSTIFYSTIIEIVNFQYKRIKI